MVESLDSEIVSPKQKIGIVTLFGDNYGNKLQNYALQKILEKFGYTVETIIIKNGNNIHWNESFKEKLVKLKPMYIISYIIQLIRNKSRAKEINENLNLVKTRADKFNLFTEKFIHISAFTIDANQEIQDKIIDEYKYFVTGSDQVWNRTKSPFFLTFAPKSKRIAFAPSFGINYIPKPLYAIYRKWLNEIPYLSVREEQGAVIIKELTGRDVPVLPDPTLCLSKEDWMIVEKEPSFDTSSYVLTYFLGSETTKYRRYIEKYAKKNDFHIINLLNLQEPEHYTVDPTEFVWLIHHAKMMFTDSFHGTVFSLIFHTPFLVFDRIENGGTSMGSRIDTLLKMSGLLKQHFGIMKENEIIAPIDFKIFDRIIIKKSQEAREFLASAVL